jgi:hypothetical protein
MVYLQYLGAFVGLVACFLTFKKIYREEEAGVNFTSWVLWGAFDTITAVASIFEKGNWVLPFVYAIGAYAVTLLLYRKGKVKFSWVEAVVSPLVIICLAVVWYTSGNIDAIIASIGAIVISSVPQVVDTWKKPSETPLMIYLYFGAAEILSFLGGTSWSVEQKLYPGTQFIICIFIILSSFGKRKVSPN